MAPKPCSIVSCSQISFDEIKKMGSQAPAEDQEKDDDDDDEFRKAFLNAIKKEHDEVPGVLHHFLGNEIAQTDGG